MGQPLRTPLGHPVSLPPLHRPLLPRLRHATRPFLPPARRSAHSVALQLPAPFHRPPPHHPRCPRLAKKPPLSPPHLPAGGDRLCLHSDDVARRPQPIRHLKKMPRLINSNSGFTHFVKPEFEFVFAECKKLIRTSKLQTSSKSQQQPLLP